MALTKSVRTARFRKPWKSLVYIRRFSCTKEALPRTDMEEAITHHTDGYMTGDANLTASIHLDPQVNKPTSHTQDEKFKIFIKNIQPVTNTRAPAQSVRLLRQAGPLIIKIEDQLQEFEYLWTGLL